MRVSSAYQSKEARPPLPFSEYHSYIFATGGLSSTTTGGMTDMTCMYSQTIYDIPSIFCACQRV